MFIDSHCHLDFDDFAQAGILDIVQNARQAGVTHMVSICTEIAKFDEILNIAQKYREIYCSIGTHPHNASSPSERQFDLDYIVDMAGKYSKIIAIGETGLDYYYNKPPYTAQIESFKKHLKAAVRAKLPAIIHTRNADDDTYKIMADIQKNTNYCLNAVMHCFSSGKKLAKEALELGFYISISGIVTFKNATELREIVEFIPEDRLLIETDAPYLAPVPHRGKRNEPAFIVETAKKIAEIKSLSLEEVAKITTNNFYSLFKKAKKN